MEYKFLPGLWRDRSIGRETGSAVSHAISGSPAATSGMYGSVFAGSDGGLDIQEQVQRWYERVIWAYRCVDAISTVQSRLPMQLVQEDPDELVDDKVLSDPTLWRMLNRRMNIHEKAQQARYRISSLGLLSKRGVFLEKIRNGAGEVVKMEILPPWLVEPIPDKDTFVSGYRFMNGITTQEDILPAEDVIWLRFKPHPTNPYLQSTPLTAAGLAADTDFLARLYNRQFLLNDGRPGMLITIAGKMNRNDMDELKQRFNGGPENAGRTTIVEGDDMHATDLAASPRDMQYLETIKGAKEDILLAFGTPESVLGNASGRTYDNADAERENWMQDTVVPHCDAFADGLDALTGSTKDNNRIKFDYSKVPVLQRHKKARHDKLADDYDNGRITLDEYYKGTGREEWNVPASRVLIFPSGIIVGRSQEDVDAVAALPLVGVPQQPDYGSESQQGAYQGAIAGQRSASNINMARSQQLAQLGAKTLRALPAGRGTKRQPRDFVDAEFSEDD